jgi:mercuric ion transport protein
MPVVSTNLPKTDQAVRGAGAPLLALGGLAAAFGAASCCALPILLAAAGIGSAWLGSIALFTAPLQPLLLVVAAVCLVGGGAMLWRQRKAIASCAPGAICARPAVRRLTTLNLLLGFILLYLGYAFA